MMWPLGYDSHNLANKDINTTQAGRPANRRTVCNFSGAEIQAEIRRLASSQYPDRATGDGTEAGRAVRQSRAMASARKPVIVRKFSRDWFAGYAAAEFGQSKAELEILDQGGKVVRMGWDQVKWVCWVRDFPSGSADQANPERLIRKRFSVRPRTPGLWLRLVLTDGDELEGLAANDRTLVDGAGLMLTPPDTRSNTQRIFVPRQAMQSLEVMSLIGAAAQKRAAKAAAEAQPELFGGDE